MIDNWSLTHKWAKMIIDGYIKSHKHHCKKEDCPIRDESKRNIITRKKLVEFMRLKSKKLTELQQLLIELLEKSYIHTTWDYSECVSLRINYSIFLIERLNTVEEASQQLIYAEKHKPSLDQCFIIFRFKKMI